MMILCIVIHFIYNGPRFFLYENVMKNLYHHERTDSLTSHLDFPSYVILSDVLLIYLFLFFYHLSLALADTLLSPQTTQAIPVFHLVVLLSLIFKQSLSLLTCSVELKL